MRSIVDIITNKWLSKYLAVYTRVLQGIRSMKIVVGMGFVDEYIDYVMAGADEVFIGYISEEWSRKYSDLMPANRREVYYYNVQLGSYSEMMILSEMVKVYKVPVTITFNALSYTRVQIQDIIKMVDKCYNLGFCKYIVADYELFIGLVSWKNEYNKDISIHISGEYSELNHVLVEKLFREGADRIIFPRQTSLGEMKKMICQFNENDNIENINKNAGNSMEFEAFVMNEKCHFTGAYCNSLHCDEMCHMCKVDYVFVKDDENTSVNEMSMNGIEEAEAIVGNSGCGLCALWKLRDAKVEYLKIVGRGGNTENTIKEISSVKKALEILKKSNSENEYIKEMKKHIFGLGETKTNMCSGNCYYKE